jgi:hypothetical protein
MNSYADREMKQVDTPYLTLKPVNRHDPADRYGHDRVVKPR